MITTVTLNPAIDRAIRLTKVELGTVHRVEETREDIGGKGINVSRVLAFFGSKTVATGILGKQNSQIFIDALKEAEIPQQFLQIEGATRTNIKMQESNLNRTSDFNEKGLEVSEEARLAFEALLADLMEDTEYLVLAGSLPPGLPKNYYGHLASRFGVKAEVAVDASGKSLLTAVENGAAIIKPNLEELEEAYGVSLEAEEEIISFCQGLLKSTCLERILLTLGGDGAMYFDHEQVIKGLPVQVEVKNTVSAGDSFLAGFLSGLDQGKAVEEAFRMAIACGTLAVTMPGTEIFSKVDYQKMLKCIEIRRIG